ncbi:hypothetical protein VIBNIMADA3020_20005 [Vibrio nigripulchritudo MADA3020]|nr:hypothetical protein VIBNIMADA3020_20005 [Vibrio nigripulchritudo MADA3020]CCN54084.1 hypothetical protein VIBNIMADA3021_510005 [Vibrio nigripulchritudo MADA3021]
MGIYVKTALIISESIEFIETYSLQTGRKIPYNLTYSYK